MKAENDWAVDLEHHVSGSPEKVFEYFTDPEKYRKWQGLEAELDPRPGGVFKVTTAPDVWARGAYVAVERPHRILLTWGFESHGPPLPRGLEQVPPGSSTVEFTFVEDGDGTIIRVRHMGLPSEEAQWAHEQGWKTYLPRLGLLQKGDDPGEEPIIELAEVLYGRDAELSARSEKN
jgi:uncharacterized protein YndB with AHSA1/START domain